MIVQKITDNALDPFKGKDSRKEVPLWDFSEALANLESGEVIFFTIKGNGEDGECDFAITATHFADTHCLLATTLGNGLAWALNITTYTIDFREIIDWLEEFCYWGVIMA